MTTSRSTLMGLLTGLLLAVGLGTVGCASASRDSGFGDIERLAAERTGKRVAWNQGSSEDRAADEAVGALLARELDADAAVQVALLNNRDLQATFEELSVAQSELVAAGMLRNPVFNADIRFGTSGGGTGVDLSVVQDFLDVFAIPLRRRAAGSAFEVAKLRVAGAVLGLAGETRRAFYSVQAARQRVEVRQTAALAADASYDYARRLHTAGNINDLDLSNEQAAFEQSRLDLAAAEADVAQARERLNVLLGVWGQRTQWTIAGRLSDPPEPGDAAAPEGLERRAVEKSLDLAAGRQTVEGAAARLGLARPLGVFEGASVGATAERETEGGWSVGPAFSLPIPLFNQGQPATSAAASELRRARQRYAALAVDVRSGARAAWSRLDAARSRAAYYKQVILPLRQRIVEQTQRQFNAMQVSPFQLLSARQQQVEAGGQYVDALLEYWTARTDYDLILNGKLPDHAGASAAPPRMRMQGNGAQHD